MQTVRRRCQSGLQNVGNRVVTFVHNYLVYTFIFVCLFVCLSVFLLSAAYYWRIKLLKTKPNETNACFRSPFIVYGIRPGNGSGLFYSSRGSHGANNGLTMEKYWRTSMSVKHDLQVQTQLTARTRRPDWSTPCDISLKAGATT